MKNKERYIFLALSVLWMAVIFYFSGQTGGQSGSLSGSLAALLHIPEWLVRKGAHLAEYAVLGFFLAGFFGTFPRLGRGSLALALLIGVLYAASDEFHQMFSSGRTPSVRDVCIDSAGAVIGILLMAALSHIRRRRAERREP